MFELADAVVLVAQGAPTLMLGDQPILGVVFISQWPVTVMDIHQATESVIAVVNFLTISQCFHEQAASGVTLIFSDQFATVVAVLSFLQQVAIQVVFVGSTATIKSSFLLYEPV